MQQLRVVTDGTERLQVATAAMPFGPGFPRWIVEQADRVEIWGSTLYGESADVTEFRLMAGTSVLATRSIPGY